MQRTKLNDDDDQSCILNFRTRSERSCSWTENGGIHVNFQGMSFDLNFARVISCEWAGNYTKVGDIDSIGLSTSILPGEVFACEEYWVNKLHPTINVPW